VTAASVLLKQNETRKVLVGAKNKTVPVGILGTAENATLGLIAGPSVERNEISVKRSQMRTIPGTNKRLN
jgi:HAE1 family hydrophobic/amphiphilic exporter-1